MCIVLTTAHVVRNRNLKFVLTTNRPLNGGYSLVYSNNTLPGMSGGSVFNEAGETIAIHGKGDIKESTQTSNVNNTIRLKTGFNLSIPTNALSITTPQR